MPPSLNAGSLPLAARPFDEADVRGVCGIAESTKDKFSIGRFGIGFKSVYTFTDRPEIHSGDEDFAIKDYVQPQQEGRTERKAGETQIVLPLKDGDDIAQKEITAGFRHLGPGALLFLRHIEEINWSVEGGASGFFLRNSPEAFGSNVHRITVIGQESGKAEVDQNWLVFHREMFSDMQEAVGRVEIAFSLVAVKDEPGRWSVQPVASSPLVVFFPTVVQTNLGFLVQGPYRTTPSRDNIPRGESLGDLEERRGRGIFDGSYSWSHYGERRTPPFPAAFVRRLNAVAWVPDAKGELFPPNLVLFDPLGWKTNPFLLTKIAFKPPIIDQLAKEAGIDPAALDLLRKLGITSVADLTSRLGITGAPPEDETPTDDAPDVADAPSDEVPAEEGTDDSKPSGDDVYDDAKDLYGDGMPDIPPGTHDSDGGDDATRGSGRGVHGGIGSGTSRGGGQGNGGPLGGSGGHTGGGVKGGGSSSGGQGKRAPGSASGRPFISYLGTHPDDEADPDGLDQATRMKIEDHAITLIISLEPALQRTPEGNPGFDLFEANGNGQPVRWVEVKSMTGSLENRPVGLSRAQFDHAHAKGNSYWLYVVEHATDVGKARVLRIQNPVGHARTFTFDKGWMQVARTEPPKLSQSKA